MDARRPEQVAADAAEAAATVRYLRQRKFVGLLDEAIADAEAIWCLEAAGTPAEGWRPLTSSRGAAAAALAA